MSDESPVQERATKVLGDDQSSSRTHVRVDKKEFSKLLHQVLAAKNLVIHLQSVAGENKKLKQRNDELERMLYRSNKTFSQIVISDNKGSRSGHIRGPESGSMSLPSYFNFESDFNPSSQAGKTFSSLHVLDTASQVIPIFQKLDRHSKSSDLSQSVPSSLYVSSMSDNLSKDSASGICEQGISVAPPAELEEKEKTDPCKDEDTGQSLKIDGDLRSMNYIPQYKHSAPATKFTTPTPSSHISPLPSLSSQSDDNESVALDNQSETEEVHAVTTAVSKQYFDVVVKELTKSKHLIKQLLAQAGERPKDVMDSIYLKQMIQSLEDENQRLKDSNLYFRNLLVTEATSGDQTSSANTELLNLHDKVQKLERQRELQNTAFDQINKQYETWKRYGQKAIAAQYSPKKDDQVFPAQLQDSMSQTEAAVFVSVSCQTEQVPVTRQPQRDSKMATMLTEYQAQIKRLEAMVGDLTLEKLSVQETVELLTSQNRNLEQSYQQVLENLAELERNQDTSVLREDIRGLTRENEDMKKRLKDDAEEIKFLRYQVQSAQSDMGMLGQQKTRAEAALKTEQERASQRETQLFTQCSKLQHQINKLESENEKLRMRIPSNVAHVQPLMKEISQEPTSMPVMSYKAEDFLHHRGKDVSLMTGFHQSDPCLLKRKPSDDDSQYLCHHCLRTDFNDEKSFSQHMQKCGD